MDQSELDDLSDSLKITYDIVDNLSLGRFTFKANISFKNDSKTTLTYSQGWSLFFCHLRALEPDNLSEDNEYIYLKQGLKLRHHNGDVFSLSPTMTFADLSPGMTLTLPILGETSCVSRSDIFPNWYLCGGDQTEPRVVKSTVGESLEFVGPFDAPEKWKRYDYRMLSGERMVDSCSPPTPKSQFDIYKNLQCSDPIRIKMKIIPEPYYTVVESSNSLDIKFDDWICFCKCRDFNSEMKLLCDGLNIKNIDNPDANSATSNIIIIDKVDELTDPYTNQPIKSLECYFLCIDMTKRIITLKAVSRAGVFYGVQSLLMLFNNQSEVAQCKVVDAPRYSYRGMHIDVARNFHDKDEIMKLIDVMAMYKLNYLHFHLTDDEGWRIEIPDLDELTSVSAYRGHDIFEKTKLLPYLGSGAISDPKINRGCGYYTTEDYRDILRYAASRHITVIPEVDLPGHAHAAINAMQVRYERLMAAGKSDEAKKYLLLDQTTVSEDLAVVSVQNFYCNAVDPTLESTYTFIEKIISTLISLHEDIQPLKLFHLGGDEVPFTAWGCYGNCSKLYDSHEIDSLVDLMETFVVRVSKILERLNLDLGIWQDGLLVSSKHGLIKKESLNVKTCYAYAWRNNFDSKSGCCTNSLANADYQVIQCEGSFLYFDHPQSSDPHDHGLHWATRYIDTARVFNMTPDDLLLGYDMKRCGAPFTEKDRKKTREMWSPLTKKQNIIGVQGQLWSELVRTSAQLHSLIVPRILALAERAWKCASWESQLDKHWKKDQQSDWSIFSAALGSRELPRLDKLGIAYYLPIPGAVYVNNLFHMNSAYPGLPLQYSLDDGQTWTTYHEPLAISSDHVLLRLCSSDMKRFSRVTKMCCHNKDGCLDDVCSAV